VPPSARALASGRGSAVAIRYIAVNAVPVLKKWLVHVARTGADASDESGMNRGGADIGRVAAHSTQPTV